MIFVFFVISLNRAKQLLIRKVKARIVQQSYHTTPALTFQRKIYSFTFGIPAKPFAKSSSVGI